MRDSAGRRLVFATLFALAAAFEAIDAAHLFSANDPSLLEPLLPALPQRAKAA